MVKKRSVSLTINGREMRAIEGESLLWVALDNGVHIPNLCAIRERSEPFASCRLCFVKIKGRAEPVTACTVLVEEGMVVDTTAPEALELTRTSFELLLSNLPLDCAHCPKSGRCEVQEIARYLGVKFTTRRFKRVLRDLPVDSSSPLFIYDPNRCVLCGKCVWVCREKLGLGVIGFAYRGFRRMVTTFGDVPFAESACQNCGECVRTCPTGAFTFKKDVLKKQSPKKTGRKV